MNYQHAALAGGKWQKMSFAEQMSNVGSEVNRAILWREKNNLGYSKKAFERSLELLTLTIADLKNKKRLKELTRLYEILVDDFSYNNEYGSTNKSWQNYFLSFNYLARINL